MNFKKLKGQFIGPKEIKKITLDDSKTYFGKERVLIEYKNGESEVLPQKVLAHIVTRKIVEDLAMLQKMRTDPVISDVLSILAESELTMGDISHAMKSRLFWSLDANMAIGATYLWGKPADELTLYDVEKVLKLIRSKKKDVKRLQKKA